MRTNRFVIAALFGLSALPVAASAATSGDASGAAQPSTQHSSVATTAKAHHVKAANAQPAAAKAQPAAATVAK